jgi:hypothetical protein
MTFNDVKAPNINSSPLVTGKDVSSLAGVVAAALEIAEKRAKILEDMRAAILADDTPKVLAFAKALCGIENEREKTH